MARKCWAAGLWNTSSSDCEEYNQLPLLTFQWILWNDKHINKKWGGHGGLGRHIIRCPCVCAFMSCKVCEAICLLQPMSVIILMKAAHSGLFLSSVDWLRRAKTNNPHHIFTGLIVLMPDQQGDTVIYPTNLTHTNTNRATQALLHSKTHSAWLLNKLRKPWRRMLKTKRWKWREGKHLCSEPAGYSLEDSKLTIWLRFEKRQRKRT